MKTLLKGTAAAVALISFAGVAHAAPHFDETTYSVNAAGFAAGNGSRYYERGNILGDTGTAAQSVTHSFTLTGAVNKDCSYYGGGTNAHSIDFGTIGIHAGDDRNVSEAFEMVSPGQVNINSATAGCNFNNTVTITKSNGAQGMVNAAAGGFDSNQFQANIPYAVNATWTGVALNTVGAGTPQSINLAGSNPNGSLTQGAWRSDMNILVTLNDAQKALVAGNYSDTLVLELAAF